MSSWSSEPLGIVSICNSAFFAHPAFLRKRSVVFSTFGGTTVAAKKKTSKGRTTGSKSKASTTKATPSVDDAAYTSNVVVPLLVQMGFVDVSVNHGISELEGDVLFAEFDRFGFKKHFAAHVKADSISGKTKADLSSIIEHVTRAFDLKFSDPVSQVETGISHVYVVTAQKFTYNAEEQALKDKSLSGFEHRLSFFEGRQIDMLHQSSFKAMKELLIGAKNELNKNSNIAQYNMDQWGGAKASLFRYQTNNTHHLVDFLVMREILEVPRKKLEKYLFLIDSFNLAANVVLFSNTPTSSVHYMKRLEEGASAAYKQSEELLSEVQALIAAPPLSH